jgi:hypothetical protein
MKTVFRWLVVVGIILQFSSLSAYAGWKNIVADNGRKAAEYISLLKAGAEPDSIKRPFLRHVNTYEAKQQKKRFIKAMDEAEELARAGRHEQIMELEIDWRGSEGQTDSDTPRKKAAY